MQIVSDGKRNASARSAFYSKISLKETLTLALLQPELWTIYGTQKRGDFVRKSVSSSRRSNESSKKKSTPTTLGYQNETFCETVLRLVSHREKFTMCSKRHIFFLSLFTGGSAYFRSKKGRIRYTWMQSNHIHVLWRSKGSHSIPALHTFA